MVSKCKQRKGMFIMFWAMCNPGCVPDDSNLLVIACLLYCALKLLCKNVLLQPQYDWEVTKAAAATYTVWLSPEFTQWPALRPATSSNRQTAVTEMGRKKKNCLSLFMVLYLHLPPSSLFAGQ